MPIVGGLIGTNTNTSGTTLAVTVPSTGVPAGAAIFVGVVEKNNAGTFGTLADSASNSYSSQFTSLPLNNLQANGRGNVFRVFTAAALTSGQTITYTKQTNGSTCAMSAVFFTGVGSLDNIGLNAFGSTGTMTVNIGPSTGNVADLAVGFLLDSGTSAAGAAATFTQASGWTSIASSEANSGTAAAGNARVNMGWRLIDGGTVAFAPTLSSTAQVWQLETQAGIALGFHIPGSSGEAELIAKINQKIAVGYH